MQMRQQSQMQMEQAGASQPPRPRREKEIIPGLVVGGSLFMLAALLILLVMEGRFYSPGRLIDLLNIRQKQESVEILRGAYYQATGSAVNIRTGPGMEYDVTGRALQGEVLAGTGNISADGAWIELVYDPSGATGWASSGYLERLD